MRWISFVPMLCGLAVVVQGGLNRRLAGQWGLVGATVVNTFVVLAVVLSLYALTRTAPGMLPQGFGGGSGASAGFSWWYLLPGVCGAIIVLGMPLAIGRMGAVHSVLLLIAAQLLTSLAWDALVEGRPPTLARVVGIAITFAGAAIVVWKG
ncbi:DMT family transporter [Myxococcaceae bacterium GXIMD 01537]